MNTPPANDLSTVTAGSDAAPARSFAERHRIDLQAHYQVEGLPLWLRCRVVDISMHGAGLLLIDEVTDPLRSVVLDVRAPNREDRIVLHGEVRHSSSVGGRGRIGVEFRNLGRLDELALCELIARHAELGVSLPKLSAP